jgi:predicted alpha/beta hydrolase family esterase
MKAILIPVNGGATPEDFWFPYLERELPKLGIEVINKQFPDAMLARSEYWLPFIKELGADEETILIGHSSGALAAMRYAELSPILGSVLVGTAHTDQGDANEKASHYFDAPWNWDAIKHNQKWIIEFHSTDDPYIPVEEARFVHEQLSTDYHEYSDKGHFQLIEFPELIEALNAKL